MPGAATNSTLLPDARLTAFPFLSFFLSFVHPVHSVIIHVIFDCSSIICFILFVGGSHLHCLRGVVVKVLSTLSNIWIHSSTGILYRLHSLSNPNPNSGICPQTFQNIKYALRPMNVPDSHFVAMPFVIKKFQTPRPVGEVDPTAQITLHLPPTSMPYLPPPAFRHLTP